jgi:hypothetical protein
MSDYRKVFDQTLYLYELIIEEPEYMKEYIRTKDKPEIEPRYQHNYGKYDNDSLIELLKETKTKFIDVEKSSIADKYRTTKTHTFENILNVIVENKIYNPAMRKFNNLFTYIKLDEEWSVMFLPYKKSCSEYEKKLKYDQDQSNNLLPHKKKHEYNYEEKLKYDQEQLNNLLLEIKEDLFLIKFSVGAKFYTENELTNLLDLKDSKIDIRKSSQLHKVKHINIYTIDQSLSYTLNMCINNKLYTSDIYLIDGVLCINPHTLYNIGGCSKYQSRNPPLEISFKKNKPIETNKLSIYVIDNEIHNILTNKVGTLYVFGKNLYTEFDIKGLFIGILNNIDYKKNMLEYNIDGLKVYKINDGVYDMYNLFQKINVCKDYVKTELFTSNV